MDEVFDDYGADYNLDYDSMYEDYEDYFYDASDYTFRDLWKDCLVPTVSDGLSSCYKLFFCCILLKLNISLNLLPDFAFHCTSFLSGLYCLHSFFGYDIFYIVIFAVVGYCILLLANNILKQYQGVVAALTCFIFLIVCELFFAEKTMWHRIRGSQMLLSMKLISLGFDASSAVEDIPPPLATFGYLFHPGTVIFGPWVSYSSYLASRDNSKFNLSWLLDLIRSFSLSFVFLTVSACWTSWFFQNLHWKWIDAYKDALSFRSSHYFVSYMSEVTAHLSGLRVASVVSAFNIEIPYSLVEVVIWWNVPMHFWLKTYVFKTAKPLGDFAAIILTYIASSLLHGLNFQLAAVLLSLGFYTYIEHVLRKKLALAFQACILARKCRKNCEHVHTHTHPLVILTNIGFGILAIFHLAYLGVMFDSASGIEEEGYNMNHTLEKWSQLSFSSHWVALGCYMFYKLI